MDVKYSTKYIQLIQIILKD